MVSVMADHIKSLPYRFNDTHAVLGRRVLTFFIVLLAASAMGAISFGPVPIQWIAQVGVVTIYVKLLLRFRRIPIPGGLTLHIFVLWSLIVTLFNSFNAPSMPTNATSIYPIYITLRFFKLAAFLASLSIVFWLVINGYRDALVRWIVILGCVVSGLAIYVYVAQVVGLPDIPRTRLGTAGGEAGTTFTYAFHRAMGSFQEPSHLAEWLVLPFFLSMGSGQAIINYRSALIGVVLLLTGSLTGMISAAAGGGIALISLIHRDRATFYWALRTCLIVVAFVSLLILVINLTVKSNDEVGVDLWKVITDRMSPIIEEGLGQSNRDYVYEFISTIDFPIFGNGVGNTNLLFSQDLGIDVVASLLSLYLSTIYSLGILGGILLFIFLVLPLFVLLKSFRGTNVQMAWAIVAAYMSWLVMFSVHSEEFSMMFGISYALIVTLSFQRIKSEQKNS